MSGNNPTPVPDPTYVVLQANQVQALRALLQLVHYDDLATSWLEMLPRSLQTVYKKSEYDYDFGLSTGGSDARV